MLSRTDSASTYLDQPKAGRLNIQYRPDNNECVHENPPRFTWLPVLEDEAQYIVRYSSDPGYSTKTTHVIAKIPLNFHTPDHSLPSGDYVWSYAVCDPTTGKPITAWSNDRSFNVAEGLPKTPLMDRKTRYTGTDGAHPRLWMTAGQLENFKAEVTKDADHCTWARFYEKSVLPWMDREIMTEPAGYPDHQRVASVWRQTYIDCQEQMYAIRHLAIGGHVTNNTEMLERAKAWLLETATWDPAGNTSRAYTDEWAYRVCNALAWGYDWLHGALSEDERTTVRKALLSRTRDVAEHAIANAKIHLFPYDSHAVRSVSAVIIPACIVMLDEEPEAREWLDYSIEFLFTVYSPWGDAEGGWAEGPHYWMTGMAYLIDASNLLKSYVGIDLFRRPFFQKTGDMPLYTKAPDTRRATFGDDSTIGDLPCLKLGYNLRQLAGVTGNTAYQWYYDEIKRNDPGTEEMFYNYGWWDLNFDDLVYHSLWPRVDAKPPSDDDQLRWFKGIGWAAIQHRMGEPKEHIQFVFKASPFGSISHSHGDQNAFCLSAFGEDLAIQSGHYVAFNSTMHQVWRKQTLSKNAILINGNGQYAGRDKALQMRSTGHIIAAEERDDHIYIRGDATAAYALNTPEVTCVEREVYFFNNSFLVFVDSIDANEPVEIDWRIHANERFQLGKSTFRNTAKQAGFYGEVIWSESGPPILSQDTGFSGVDMAEIEGLPVSTCMTARFAKAARHRIATLLVPYRLSDPRRIFHFIDDQGYDADLYFTDAEENTFKVVMKKLASTNI